MVEEESGILRFLYFCLFVFFSFFSYTTAHLLLLDCLHILYHISTSCFGPIALLWNNYYDFLMTSSHDATGRSEISFSILRHPRSRMTGKSWNVEFLATHDGPSRRALVILNQPFSFPLLQRVWASSQWHCCADGGANRLHDAFDNSTVPNDSNSRKLYLYLSSLLYQQVEPPSYTDSCPILSRVTWILSGTMSENHTRPKYALLPVD